MDLYFRADSFSARAARRAEVNALDRGEVFVQRARVRVVCLAGVLGLGCFVDLGLPGSTGDEGSSATSSPTTLAGSSGADPSAGPTGTSSAGEPSSGEVGPCVLPGQTCSTVAECCGCLTCVDGACVAAEGACGVCETCGLDGVCGPGLPGAPCTVADAKCQAQAWGVEAGVCYRFSGATGVCLHDGACGGIVCAGRGEAVASCADGACVRAGVCQAGQSVRGITAASLCEDGVSTAGCDSYCEGGADGSSYHAMACIVGACVETEIFTCGGYACDGQHCGATCGNNGGCDPNYECLDGACNPIPPP